MKVEQVDGSSAFSIHNYHESSTPRQERQIAVHADLETFFARHHEIGCVHVFN